MAAVSVTLPIGTSDIRPDYSTNQHSIIVTVYKCNVIILLTGYKVSAKYSYLIQHSTKHTPTASINANTTDCKQFTTLLTKCHGVVMHSSTDNDGRWCVPQIKYLFACDQIRTSEMGGACSTYGDSRGAYSVLVGRSEGNRPLWRPKHRWVREC
jgi:hypothetical protein